jgi:hypothetical protein
MMRNIIAGLAAMIVVAVAHAYVPAMAQTANPDVQTEAQGTFDDSQMWQAIRKGTTGNVSIPDKNAAILIQSEGDNWRAIRNGPVSLFSAAAIFGVVFCWRCSSCSEAASRSSMARRATPFRALPASSGLRTG